MILEQMVLGCLSQASYLVGDETSGRAAVVDPRRDVEDTLDVAERHGLTIQAIILTHFHADFVSGHLELQQRTGAPIHMGRAARPEYAVEAVSEADEIVLGSVRLRFLETPGHTPESICVLVFDDDQHLPDPVAVLTGDTLFVGDVGRPDLTVAGDLTVQDMASQLYDSLHTKLLKLPEATRVYPGHGAGSLCGKNIGRESWSTIGQQRRFNLSLQHRTRQEFVAAVTAGLPEMPAYFAHDARMNRSMHDVLDDVLQRSLRPLDIDEVLERVDAGAVLLDVRPGREYTAAHIHGCFHVGLDGEFAAWCGALLPDGDIVLVGEDGQEHEAAMRLGRVGFDRVVGYLDGGVESLEARPDLLRHTSQINAQALVERLSGNEPPQILDVRTEAEFEDAHVLGSFHLPLHELPRRLDEVPRNSNFVVLCAMGYRSLIAASILERNGFTNFSDLAGGYLAWDLTRVEG
jgi:glyoxylase-like metal-dependent hydrolase (beta-lactamase superfamily II)/rhodanese-related sulfurtransferase